MFRRESEALGIHLIHEDAGRWCARTDDDRVKYGVSEADARARLIHAIWDDENAWQNQVDDDTREYIENQDDD